MGDRMDWTYTGARKRPRHEITPVKFVGQKQYNAQRLFRGQAVMVGSSHGHVDVTPTSKELSTATVVEHINIIPQDASVNRRIVTGKQT